MKKVLVGALMMFTGAVSADQVVWLNIPSHYTEDNREVPSVSFVTFGWDNCADAIVSYAKENYIHYIGCDVVPLRDAVNVNKRYE